MSIAPARITTNSYAHAQTLVHRKAALSQILKKFMFHTVGMKDMLEKQQGLTVQWHRYDVPGYNIVPKTAGVEATGHTTVGGLEGHVGSAIDDGSSVVKATLSQYTDFKTFSDIARDTLIDNVVLEGAKSLGYRGGYSVDTVIRNVVDAVSGSVTVSLLGTRWTSRDVAKTVHTMQGNDIKPFSSGAFKVIASPFVTYDLKTDPEAVGFADLLKYTKGDSVNKREDRGFIGHIHGADVYENTNVYTSGGAYRIYTFGEGGLGIVSLSGKAPRFVSNPESERFNVRVKYLDDIDLANPEGTIAGLCSYNFLFTTVVLDTSTYRFRITDATPSIS